MRTRRSKRTGKRQGSSGAYMTQKQPGGVTALTVQPQQILVHALRQVEFAAVDVMKGLPIGNLNELRGIAELFPQHSRAGVGVARFRRGESFDGQQDRSQGTAKLEFLSLVFEVVRQQR